MADVRRERWLMTVSNSKLFDCTVTTKVVFCRENEAGGEASKSTSRRRWRMKSPEPAPIRLFVRTLTQSTA